MNGSAAVHALNVAEAEAIRASGVRAPVAIIPNGIDPVPEETYVPPNWARRPTLLFLGRLHSKKGLSELIDAWTKAHPSLPDWQLAIAGWDDGPNQFRQQAAQSNAPITFLGPLYGSEKSSALAHCSAFVLPSFSEGLPITVLEAWSHGKPVLMTEACNLDDAFRAGAAIKVTTDSDALAKALIETLRDLPHLNSIGEAGRRLAEAKYTWDAIAHRFRALYAFALGETESCADIWA